MTNLEIFGMVLLIGLPSLALIVFFNWMSAKNSIKIMRLIREKYLDRCHEMDIDPNVIPEEFEYLETRMPTLKDSMSHYKKYGVFEYDKRSMFKIKSKLKMSDFMQVPRLYKKRAVTEMKFYSFLFKRKYKILKDSDINKAAFHAKLFLILTQMIGLPMLVGLLWLSQIAR